MTLASLLIFVNMTILDGSRGLTRWAGRDETDAFTGRYSAQSIVTSWALPSDEPTRELLKRIQAAAPPKQKPQTRCTRQKSQQLIPDSIRREVLPC
ncbi:MAG: hypothetical protein HC838_15300 [Spirulinaceae cyanobacterium RM2_2_10]|nr:hypothetical protein [Spirulinaceae cyanobacterium RM2_2_10]